jgi:acetolactate decarboxylase
MEVATVHRHSRRAVPVAACLVVIPACSQAPGRPFEPHQYGAMREVMREGRTESRIALAGLGRDTIAVGALAGLEGEVTVLDGGVWVARPEGDGVWVTGPTASANDEATLLTVATVERWTYVSLDVDGTVSGAALERLVERTAREHGIDTTRPFPFVIDGVVERLDIHVINGFCPHAVDPATVDAEPWRWSVDEPTPARIVGFHAADAAGVLTHHGTAIHVHALVERDGRMVTGHVDGVAVRAGARLLLPGAETVRSTSE